MNFKHSGGLADIIYSLPTLASISARHGGGATLLLQPGVQAGSEQGAPHVPGGVRMTQDEADSIAPLLASQEYLSGVGRWEGEQVDVDLDLARLVSGSHQGHLPRHYFYCFDAWYDVSMPWLHVTPLPGLRDRVVVHRSLRRRGQVDYRFVAAYDPLFVGTPEEFESFARDVPNAKFVETDDLLGMAQVIAGARCFLGNQGLGFALAEAMKAPRCLEVDPQLRNVVPCGGDARCALNPAGFEVNVRQLWLACR